jgi:hypothetical protein
MQRDARRLSGAPRGWIQSCAFSWVVEYAASWDAMSAYERCLVHWMEINAYGLEARAASESEVDWFQVRMEDLIDPQTGRLAELIDFLRLPHRARSSKRPGYGLISS